MDERGYVPLLTADDIKRSYNSVAFGVSVRLGIDPSGNGDNKTAWVGRDMFRARRIKVEEISNSKEIAEKTVTILDYYGVSSSDVYIDNLGVGANVGVELACAGKRTNPVSFADKADDSERFLNKKAEMYWRMREWCKKGGEIEGTEIYDQMLSIRYKITLSGKIQIKPKLEMRKDGESSPDEADALALTFYDDDSDYVAPESREESIARRRGERVLNDYDPYDVV